MKGSLSGGGPVGVGIVGVHVGDDGLGIGAKIPLIGFALLVDDEGHDAGVAVFRGPGDEGKAANHVAIDDVAIRPAGSVRALLGEDLEQVSVERSGSAVVHGFLEITFVVRYGEER